MSKTKETETIEKPEKSTALAIRDDKTKQLAKNLDEIVGIFVKEEFENKMEQALITANAVAEFQKLLPDTFIQKLKDELEGSVNGWKTDKDWINDKSKRYSLQVTKTCAIDAMLNGLYLSGNEFNIIGGNMYITKNGFKGKMKRNPLFSDVKISYGVPKVEKDNRRAIVKCRAKWKYNGRDDEIIDEEIVVPVSTKDGKIITGDDAILGKAERKLRCRIWEQATGNYLPEGDTSDQAFSDYSVVVEKPDQLKAAPLEDQEAINKANEKHFAETMRKEQEAEKKAGEGRLPI